MVIIKMAGQCRNIRVTQNWKNSLTQKERIIRRNVPINEIWIKNIFIKDNYTCQKCFQRGKALIAHHLEGYHWCEELRFEIYNGITLCKKCHDKFHKRFSNFWNSTEQFIIFLGRKI